MRGLLVAALIFMWLPLALFKPHIGVLVWDWVSHMQPHAHTYNFARTFPFLYLVAGATLVGIVLSKEKTKLPGHPIVFAIVFYWLWVLFTTMNGMNEMPSSEYFSAKAKMIQFTKILTFALVSMAVMRSPNRLKAFFWIMLASLAYVGVKGGLFAIITGGSARVQGGTGVIADNNQLAMALSMGFAMAVYLYQHPPHKHFKWPIIGMVVLMFVATVGTQSRGGFAAIMAVTFMLILKTKHKFKVLTVLLIFGTIGYLNLPDNIKNRLATTESAATDDGSFRGRVSMWRFATNLVEDYPIEGGGFNVFYVPRAAELYMPPGFKARAPHSIYFEVLAEHGYVGLVLFLTILFVGWYSAGSQAKQFRRYEETKWLGDLCAAMQLALVGYAVGGLTVNIATFDLFYHVLAVIVMCSTVGDQLMAGKLTVVGTDKIIGAQVEKDKWQPGGAAAHR